MKTYLELTPLSGRGKKKVVEVDDVLFVSVYGHDEPQDHRITVSRQGMVVSWLDDAAFLSGPSLVGSDRVIPHPEVSAIGRHVRSINMDHGNNAVFIPTLEAHPFVLHGRKFNRMEVTVK